jgi:Mg/Co/Ni transporter MgtE
MKKFVFLIILSLFVTSVFAQNHHKKRELGEKYQAQKVAYITNALELSSEESAAFWPIYNEHEKKENELHNEMRDFRSNILQNQENLSDNEATEALAKIQSYMNAMHEMEIKYQNKYLEVISAKKVLLLMKAEKDFRRELLKNLGEKRNKRGK